MTKTNKHKIFWLIVKVQIALMLVVMVGFLVYNYGGYAEQIRDLRLEAVELVRTSDAQTFVPSQTSVIYSADGELISYVKGEKESDYVKYKDIPKYFTTAMVSTEDKRFYEHSGIDFVAIIRSAKAIIASGSLSQGGSTITMQLARNVYLTNEKSWERKIKEMFIATELEKIYSKNKIMEYYLNNIYFANGYYGIKAACTGYFSCDLDELSLSEIAFLCAIPNSPSRYDPIVNFENTIERRNRILKNMYQDGKIDEETYQIALEEEIVLKTSHSVKSQRNNYIDTYVYYCATRALMENQGFKFKEYFSSEEQKQKYYEEYDALYASCQKQIFAEGYKIYTSIELDKQELLQKSLNATLSEFTEVGKDGVYKMQGSAVSIDNDTGYVVAIVGGREQDIGIYTLNRAYQSRRQPGSCIKPLIVFTPFFEQGNTPDTKVVDEKIEGGPEAAQYYGEVTARFAVERSLNSVAWTIFEQVKPKVGLQYLKNMHFAGLHEADENLVASLGGFTEGTSAVEMASAYATIENDGVYRKPTCIVKILDADGKVVYESGQEGVRIYGEKASRMMTSTLKTAMISGTGIDSNMKTMPCAGKTGTTNDNKDGWFVGYTRYYTTSVWVGYDLPKSEETLKGGTYPAKIWNTYMESIHEGLEPLDFLPYENLTEDFIGEHDPSNTEQRGE